MFLMNETNTLTQFPASLHHKLQSSVAYTEWFKLVGHERVLNVGCGNGAQVAAYAGRFDYMACVDVNKAAVLNANRVAERLGLPVQGYVGKIESMILCASDREHFDAALAIDVIEHVLNPAKALLNIHAMLKPGGRLLITFPAMHDRYIDWWYWLRGRIPDHWHDETDWNPDKHGPERPLLDWIALTESCGFALRRSRASTLFPPFHLLGVPKFWFTNLLIHRLDSWLCRLPGLKNLGQALICEFEKTERL